MRRTVKSVNIPPLFAFAQKADLLFLVKKRLITPSTFRQFGNHVQLSEEHSSIKPTGPEPVALDYEIQNSLWAPTPAHCPRTSPRLCWPPVAKDKAVPNERWWWLLSKRLAFSSDNLFNQWLFDPQVGSKAMHSRILRSITGLSRRSNVTNSHLSVQYSWYDLLNRIIRLKQDTLYAYAAWKFELKMKIMTGKPSFTLS